MKKIISISVLTLFFAAMGVNTITAANMVGGHHKHKTTLTKQERKQAKMEKKLMRHTKKNTPGNAQ